MVRGDIRWFRFADPDKRRPVLVLTRDSVLDFLSEVTVAPLTRTIRGIASEVLLTPADGVPRDCAVNCDHIETVPRNKLGSLIASLGADRLDEVREAVIFALGFSRSGPRSRDGEAGHRRADAEVLGAGIP
jgi:mRNA interferase MazF